jgi:hypothetical protein
MNVKLVLQTTHHMMHNTYSIEIVSRKFATKDNPQCNIYFDILLYCTFCDLGSHTYWISLIGKVVLLVNFFFLAWVEPLIGLCGTSKLSCLREADLWLASYSRSMQ